MAKRSFKKSAAAPSTRLTKRVLWYCAPETTISFASQREVLALSSGALQSHGDIHLLDGGDQERACENWDELAQEIELSPGAYSAVILMGHPTAPAFHTLCAKARKNRLPIILLDTEAYSAPYNASLITLGVLRLEANQSQSLFPLLKLTGAEDFNTEARYWGPIAIDENTMTLAVEDKSVLLTVSQMALFMFLYTQQDRTIPRDQLLNRLDNDGDFDDRTIDTHIKRIRSKIDKLGISSTDVIKTVYGGGYQMPRYSAPGGTAPKPAG